MQKKEYNSPELEKLLFELTSSIMTSLSEIKRDEDEDGYDPWQGL